MVWKPNAPSKAIMVSAQKSILKPVTKIAAEIRDQNGSRNGFTHVTCGCNKVEMDDGDDDGESHMVWKPKATSKAITDPIQNTILK